MSLRRRDFIAGRGGVAARGKDAEGEAQTYI
jgi:hypothetical protein